MTQVLAENAAQPLLKGITVPSQPQIMVDPQVEMTMPNVSEYNFEDLQVELVDGSLTKCCIDVRFFG